MTTPAPVWRRSSFSVQNCVEMALVDLDDGSHGVAVRDSKRPDGAVLRFTVEEWESFLDGVKVGEFDTLLRPADLEQNAPAS